MNVLQRLQPTSWLAQRLGLSVATIERLRAQHPEHLPPCVVIGRSVRYDQPVVEQWLRERMQPQARPTPVLVETDGQTDHP